MTERPSEAAAAAAAAAASATPGAAAVLTEAPDELPTSCFGRAVARQPRLIMLVSGLSALVLSALGPLVLENNITAGTEGFEPRGSLLADRQLQSNLLRRLPPRPAGLRRSLSLRGRRNVSTTSPSAAAPLLSRRQLQPGGATSLATMLCVDGGGNDQCRNILDIVYECADEGCTIATAANFHAICELEDRIRALDGYADACARPSGQCCAPRSLPRIAELLYSVECSAITDAQAAGMYGDIVSCANLRGEVSEEVRVSGCDSLGPLASMAIQAAEWGTTSSGTVSRSAICLSGSPWDDRIHEGIILPAFDNVLMPMHKNGGLRGGALTAVSWGSQRNNDKLQNDGLQGDVVLGNFVGVAIALLVMVQTGSVVL